MAIVRWTQHALDDLRDIHDFIARDSPRAAESLVERLLTATERLATFSESGRGVPEVDLQDGVEATAGGRSYAES
jgi:plasmid stabilization system protein ParE